MAKNLYVIAGPNGAGKTTFAKRFLPDFAKCDEFVNADMIATGLSPFDPRASALQAGKLMLLRIHDLVRDDKDFGFETTLSGKSYLRMFKEIRKKGYKISLFFLWIPNVSLAIKRVEDRVRQGGHSVPVEDIRRRYARGIVRLFGNYMPLLDQWVIFDNSEQTPQRIAYSSQGTIEVKDQAAFQKLKVGMETL